MTNTPADKSIDKQFEELPDDLQSIKIKNYPWQAEEPEKPHRHDGLEWNLILAGHAQRMVNDQVLSLTPGSLVAIPKGVQHAMVACSNNLHLWVIWDKADQNEFTESAIRQLNARDRHELDMLLQIVHRHQEESDAKDQQKINLRQELE